MSDEDVMQSDLRELLLALDMGDHARPQSPHEVFQDALAEVRRIKARLADVEEALTPFAAILMNGEPVGPIPRGYLDKSLTRDDLRKASALMRDPSHNSPRWAVLL